MTDFGHSDAGKCNSVRDLEVLFLLFLMSLPLPGEYTWACLMEEERHIGLSQIVPIASVAVILDELIVL